MQTIGSYLKSGREARNIRLSEVARSTKISKWYLDCLEKDEYDKIPGGPYIKGYIASYASFIGIKEDEILKRYDSLQINSDDNETSENRLHDQTRQKVIGFSSNKTKLYFLSLGVLIFLALGANHFFFQKQFQIRSLLPDAWDANTRSAPASKTKQDETLLAPNDNSGQSSDIKKVTKNSGKKFQQNVGENDAGSPETISKAPEINTAPGFSEKDNLNRHALTQTKFALPQDITGTAGPHLDSAPGYQTPDVGSQTVNNLRVVRAVAASDIINKNPAELIDTIHWSTERIYIWTMIECPQPPSSIRHTYYFNGRKVNDVVLKIKSPQWRTWSYKTLLDKRWIGQWRVDVTSAEKKLLQSVFFEVN